MKALLVLAGCSVLLTGCGAVTDPCSYSTVLTVSPTTATADHMAAAPGNQQQFVSGTSEVAKGSSTTGCAVPAVIAVAHPVWTNPDPQAITISSANDATNGTAVCTAATSGPVTLTATTGSGTTVLTSTVSLTCK